VIVPGALEGIRIIEMGGIGPAPFAGMLLADHGAEVIRIERPGAVTSLGDPALEIVNRSRKLVSINMKQPEGVQAIRALCATADGLIEGFRPGVMEKAGLGPDALLGANPKLVYGRMTGWGQTGPLASAAGHDINYIALTGNLHSYGRAGEKPTPPINVIGDLGGGGMLLAFAMLAGILHARSTGQGQVIDCAMTEGAALLAAMTWMFKAQGAWKDERGVNILDTGAHFYDTYECADGKFIALGAIEPQFYAEFRRLTGLDQDEDLDRQNDAAAWPGLKEKVAARFLTRTRAEWCATMEGTDACFAPVLSMEEAPAHPHNRARGIFVEAGGVIQPAPAPRFSETPAAEPKMPGRGGVDTEDVLASIGYSRESIEAMRASGTISTT
jgi:alpha-methylacyl-CoA racemase